MAITTMDGLASAMAGGQKLSFAKASMTSAAGFWSSLWAEAGFPAAGSLSVGNTANGLVPTDATAGAALINAFSGSAGYLGGFNAISTSPVQVILYDRLFHVGNISAAAAATTTLTSQPSYSGRVPGGTDFSGCEIWVEISTVIPATATTVSISYQDGAASPSGGNTRTSSQMVGTSLTGAPTKRMIPFTLATSDGVQKINSVTVATPAASGNFNVVVLRRLASHMVMAANIAEPRQDAFKVGLPVLFADSCLALMILGVSGTTSGAVIADTRIING